MRGLILLAAIGLVACSNRAAADEPGLPGTGSGHARTYQAADFTKVALRGADDVDVRVGGGFAVRAEGDPATLDLLKIERVGNTLRIGRRDHVGPTGRVKVYVTMPSIAAAAVAGSGELVIDRATGAAFEGASAGSGSIAIGALAVDRASFSLAGSGGVKAGGTAKSVAVNIAGSGDVAAPGLSANDADISVAGSGSVRLAVDGPAKVAIMGSGDVDLGGKAKCTVSKLGTGSVRCG